MHIPKGKPVHENLKTSYVNTAALLADLQISGFTGYLQLTFPNGQGYIFINAGKILNALDEAKERVRRGEEAIDAILLRVSAPDGLISVYSHNSSVIEAIAGRIDGEVVYQNLESEFTDLAKLAGKLAQQIEARFYLEVKIGSIGDGVIYIIDGNIDAVLSLAQGEIIEGEVGYERMLELVSRENAIFQVYRCRQIKIVAIGAPANVIAFPEFASIAPVNAPEPPAVASVDEITTLSDDIINITAATETIGITESVDTMAAVDSDTADAETIEAEYTAEYQEQFEKLLGLMSEVVAVVERASVLVAKDGNFAVALRAGLLEVTDQYPFFDPFSSEFEYQNGKIRFSAAAAPIDLVNGLAQALKHALRELTRSASASTLRQVVADALSRLQHLRRAEFDHFGLAPVLSEIVAIE